MLDEIREVQEYMFSPGMPGQQSDRIQLSVFWHAGNLNGIERMMTMIARYFLFVDNEDTDNIFLMAEAALRMWTGNTPLSIAEKSSTRTDVSEKEAALAGEYEYLTRSYPWLNWWLPAYIKDKSKGMKESDRDKAEMAINKLAGKKSQFGRSVFGTRSGANDYKKCTYEKAVANAYSARGPLKRYYLACTDPDWKTGLSKGNGKKLMNDHPDRVLKILASYMIERSRKVRHDDEPRYEPVNYSDIAMWAAGSSKLDGSVVSKYKVGDRPLFSCKAASSGNQAKLKPDEEWFTRCGWTLIEATEEDAALDEFLDANPGAVFFRDNGGNVRLSMNERYERA